jgi:hypothetical protein
VIRECEGPGPPTGQHRVHLHLAGVSSVEPPAGMGRQSGSWLLHAFDAALKHTRQHRVSVCAATMTTTIEPDRHKLLPMTSVHGNHQTQTSARMMMRSRLIQSIADSALREPHQHECPAPRTSLHCEYSSGSYSGFSATSPPKSSPPHPCSSIACLNLHHGERWHGFRCMTRQNSLEAAPPAILKSKHGCY